MRSTPGMLTLILLLASPGAAQAATLVTENYEITIRTLCEEGVVDCDQVRYTGVSRRSGKAITLNGSTWHSACADGAAPCRFLGYRFKSGNVVYFVGEDGVLEVLQNGNKTLVREQGTWRD